MRIRSVLSAIALLGGIALGVLATPAAAQDNWPSRPVKFIVNFAPGGSTDATARAYADRLSRMLGQQFIIENKPGASGTIGVEAAVKSPPDGYTFLATGSPVLTVVPQARKVPWDPFKDLVPVSQMADYMLPVAVNPSLPVNSLPELAAYSKANPGKVNCGSSGLGTLTHIICEALKRTGGIDNLHVPYRGGAESLNDFLAGVMQIHSEPNVLPHVKAGKAKLLAVADRERHPDYPNVPTLTEVYPGIAIVGFYALFAPAGTPDAIVKKLNAEMAKIALQPELKTQFLGLALRPVGGSPDVLATSLKNDWAYFGNMIREMNLRLD